MERPTHNTPLSKAYAQIHHFSHVFHVVTVSATTGTVIKDRKKCIWASRIFDTAVGARERLLGEVTTFHPTAFALLGS